jgi:hypothetical protein
MKNNEQQEIDLIAFLFSFYRFIIEKKWVLLFFLFAGLICGIVSISKNPLISKNYYKKNYIVYSSVVSKEIISEIILNLEKNKSGLSADTAPELKAISIDKEEKTIYINPGGINVRNGYGGNDVDRGIKITLTVYDRTKIDTVVNGIIKYINLDKYVKERQELFIRQKTELLSLLNKKIKELDTSNDAYLGEIKLNSSDKNNAALAYIQLFEEKQTVEKSLELGKTSVEFIEANGQIESVNNKPILIATIIGYGFAGLFIGIIIGVIPKLKRIFKSNLEQNS